MSWSLMNRKKVGKCFGWGFDENFLGFDEHLFGDLMIFFFEFVFSKDKQISQGKQIDSETEDKYGDGSGHGKAKYGDGSGHGKAEYGHKIAQDVDLNSLTVEHEARKCRNGIHCDR